MAYAVGWHGPDLEFRFSEDLTDADFDGLAAEVEKIEQELRVTPSRITDMTGVTGLHIAFPHILALAQRRRAMRVKNPIRSAIVVANDAQYGMARMFQTLNDHPQITVEVFRDRIAAEIWLHS